MSRAAWQLVRDTIFYGVSWRLSFSFHLRDLKNLHLISGAVYPLRNGILNTFLNPILLH